MGERPIDYLVVNHMRAGSFGISINDLCRVYPDIIKLHQGTAKTIGMIEGFYGIFDKFHESEETVTGNQSR